MTLPKLFGVVNVTPDSFSDGGRFSSEEAGIAHGLQLLEEGADVLDVGGESTRPGASPVSEEEEIRRVLPVIEGILRRHPSAVISVDTQKSEVARRSIDAGVRIVNDVSALSDAGMARVCARGGVEVVLMHLRGTPETMQQQTEYSDLVGEVRTFLQQRVQHAVDQGIPLPRLWVDPGIGFAKKPADNLLLIRSISAWKETGARVLIGASRKRFIGDLIREPAPDRRVFGSVGAALAAAAQGADALRVHDVLATRQALAVYAAIQGVL